ncbi:MAG: energy transducer TonB [Planctomycetia bacterium]|nr:energy transducer TonB [Planctomycetia bacterium]
MVPPTAPPITPPSPSDAPTRLDAAGSAGGHPDAAVGAGASPHLPCEATPAFDGSNATLGGAPARAVPGRWRRRFLTPAPLAARGPWLVALAAHVVVLGAGLAGRPSRPPTIGEAEHGRLVVTDALAPAEEVPTEFVAPEPVAVPPSDPPDVPTVDLVPTEPPLEPLEVFDPDLAADGAPTDEPPPSIPAHDAHLARAQVRRKPPPTPAVAPTPVAAAVPAAQPAAAPAPRVASGRAQLRPLHRPAPAYPEALRQSGVEGVVRLRIVVEADGSVSEATVVAGSGFEAFDAAAVETLRRWRFEPPGERQVVPSIPVRFRLR